MLLHAAFFGAGVAVGLIVAGAVLIAVAVRGLTDGPIGGVDLD